MDGRPAEEVALERSVRPTLGAVTMVMTAMAGWAWPTTCAVGATPARALVSTTGAGSQPPSVSAAAIVPPENPSQSLSPDPDFSHDGNCGAGVLDDSEPCFTDVVAAIDNGRSTLESLAPLSLNLSAFAALTVPEQLFVVTDLERTDRGLAPVAGLTAQLDSLSQSAAADNTDPDLVASTLSGGASVAAWGSVWAGGTSNALGSDYYWLYDDGVGSPNGDCTTASSPGCWGHRDNILGTFAPSSSCGSATPEQYMGAGDTATGSAYGPSFAAIIVGACGPAPTDVVFTWAQAQQALGGTSPAPPGAPQDVTATKGPRRTVVLTWQAPADDGGSAVTGYVIDRARTSGSETPFRKVACTGGTCRFVIRHVSTATLFYFTVAAVNADGTGPSSAEVAA
jgi:hypothetical protein